MERQWLNNEFIEKTTSLCMTTDERNWNMDRVRGLERLPVGLPNHQNPWLGEDGKERLTPDQAFRTNKDGPRVCGLTPTK